MRKESSYLIIMKRTKNDWKVGHPQDRNGISGLFTFDGEDPNFFSRKKEHQEAQRKWVEEQKKERADRVQKELEEDRNFAKQALKANRDRGLVEDQVERTKKAVWESVRDANLQLKAEKEAREKYERELRVQEELNDLEYQKNIRKKGAY
jgi:hypothetical protein